jgi:hypothetical protein
MKRRFSRPVILALTSNKIAAFDVKPRLLPFPSDRARAQPAPAEQPKAPDAELGEVRERLFRMIVAKEWDRSHGNRAS